MDREESRLKHLKQKHPPLGMAEEMSNPNYRLLSLRRDLERRNLSELKSLAKEQGLGVKDAVKYGNAHRRSTWVKLLLVNTPEFHVQPQERPKQEVNKPRRNKPAIPAIKQRVVYGMKRLPEIKTTVYFYHHKGE